MYRRLIALFERYAAVHLYAAAPGFPLTDYNGRPIGYVDLVTLKGNRLRVAGWVQAAHVTLQGPAAKASTAPRLPRYDVAEQLGLDPQVGFDLEIVQPGQALNQLAALVLTLKEPESVPLSVPIPLPALEPARRRLWPQFLKAVLGSVPSAMLWRLTQKPRYRFAVKNRMGLTLIPHGNSLIEPSRATHPLDASSSTCITIILPVYNAFDLLAETLERVVKYTDLPWRLLVIEDASPDSRVRPFLRDWVARHGPTTGGRKRIELLENSVNLGFIASVNQCLQRAQEIGNHVVLLNSDALVPAGWASRLLAPITADPSVASVTPMSNDAEIFSTPVICKPITIEPGQADYIDSVARRLDPIAATAPTPTGVGFCMAMNIKYVRRLPSLDPAFGRGYGEEVDWCQRARALGGRHLGTAALFVEHRGGQSFGSETKLKLIARNNSIVSRRYPVYDQEVQDFIQQDPLLSARLLLALAWVGAWSEARATHLGEDEALVPIYLAHSLGGGAEKYLELHISDDLALAGRPAVIIRVGGTSRWRIEVVGPTGIIAGATDDEGLIHSFLEPIERRHVIYSCGVGDSDPVSLPTLLLKLARETRQSRLEVLMHDYYPVSPSYTLLDSDAVYRGPVVASKESENDPAHSVVTRAGVWLDLAEWQAAWRPLMQAASQVTVFSDSSRAIVLASYPEAQQYIRVRPHKLPVEVPVCKVLRTSQRVVAVLGNINVQKGANLLVELASLISGAGSEDKTISKLVLIGNIDPNYTLPPTAIVHGDYRVSEIPALIARYRITDWLIPSIWPETFSYTTHEALATGLPVYAYNIGGQGDAVRRAHNGIAMDFVPGVQTGQTLLESLTDVSRFTLNHRSVQLSA